MDNQNKVSEDNEQPGNNNTLLLIGIIFLVVLITLSLLRPEWSAQNGMLFKTMLALAAAMVAALIPGFLHLNANEYVKASGALGVFAFIMLDPMKIIPQPPNPDPTDKFFSVVFNLKDPQGTIDFDGGILSFALLNEETSGRQQPILQNGIVKFDSISEEWRNRNVLLTLVSDKYLLKHDTLVYPLQSSVITYIKKVPLSYNKPVDDTPVSNNLTVDCPDRNPDGVLIRDDIPGTKKSGSKWVFGYYKRENGSCVWVPGQWVELTPSDCPKDPPIGYTEKKGVGRKGYVWTTGHWVLRNGSCIWVSGTWQKSSSADLPKTNGRPAPTYVPPLRPATH